MFIINRVRDLIVWSIIMMVLICLYNNPYLVRNNVMGSLLPSKGTVIGSDTYFYKYSDGHFYITAYINGVPIKFLLDTGATDIALSSQDAKRLGVIPEELDYTKSYYTANGIIKSAPVKIKKMEIGNFVLTDVRASISDAPMDISLFGMSALERFRFTIDGNQVILSAASAAKM